MFEIDDPLCRLAILRSLGGVEEHMCLQIGADKIYGQVEDDIERTTDDRKMSSVYFMRFKLTPDQVAAFTGSDTQILVVCDHENYGHIAMINKDSKAQLITDFAD